MGSPERSADVPVGQQGKATLNLILDDVRAQSPTGYKEREYDVVCAGVLVRLGPYDNSDTYRIVHLPDTNEVVVLFNDEAVHSFIMEEL